MTGKYKNRYRTETTRLQNWDYGWNGGYFITICTQNRENYFGEIVNNNIQLSEIGELIKKYWLKIPEYFSFTKLGEFIIMPNHIHGILIIDKSNNNTNNNYMDNNNGNGNDMEEMDHNNGINEGMNNDKFVETRLIASLRLIAPLPHPYTSSQYELKPSNGGITGNKNPMFHKNISRIIRWFKGRCSFEIHKINPGFNWQPRFYDHIIRNENEYKKISQYIINNPRNWKKDRFY